MSSTRAGKIRDRTKPKCGYRDHSQYSNAPLINIQKGKKIKRSILTNFISAGTISERAKYICKDCVDRYSETSVMTTLEQLNIAESQTSNMEEGMSETDQQPNEVLNIDDHFQNLTENITEDVSQLYKEKPCEDMDKLLGYDMKEWLAERPEDLIKYLKTLCQLDDETPRSHFLLCKIIEQIYNCHNERLVLPLSFRHNLITHKLSNSDLLVDLNASSTPSGAHTFLSNWLTSSATAVKFPQGTVRVIFDNEQVIGKRYHIKFGQNTVPKSVVASHAYLAIDENCTIQYEEQLKPGYWMFNKDSDLTTIINDHSKYQNYFRQSRNELIKNHLHMLHQEPISFTSNLSDIEDNIDRLLDEQNTKKFHIDNSDCPNQTDAYKHFNITPKTNNIKVIVGEPDMLNPNSLENISQIVQNVGERAGIDQYQGNGCRKWLFFEIDGGILSPLLELIHNVFRCPRCKLAFYGRVKFNEHLCAQVHTIRPTYEFDWVVPQQGIFHLEANGGKSFVNLNWNVFVQEFCKILGFESENALNYAKKGSDHHKLWELLEICYVTLSAELLVPFQKHCISNNIEATSEEYWKNFMPMVINPNYLYIQQMCFTLLHSLMLLRRGTRYANTEAIIAARSKLSLLFFGRNHPKYQKILAHTLQMEELMPEQVKKSMHSSLSVSRTGHTGHYQGGDAALEEINKEAKRWAIGVPTSSQWCTTFRNLDNLNTLREQTLTDAGVSDRHNTTNHSINLSKEIIACRMLLRKQKYLSKPFVAEPHRDITGNIDLSKNLVNFTTLAIDNMHEYIPKILRNESYKMTPVHATNEEEEESMKIENNTIAEIKGKILTLMENQGNTQSWMQLYQKEIKGKPKAKHIEFYYKLMDSN